MLLYSRTLIVRGDQRRTSAWAEEMREFVSSAAGLQFSLWAGIAGAPIGTLGFTTFVQSQAELEAATASLTTDEKYHDKVAKGMDFVVAPPEDQLVQIQHTSGGSYQRADVGAIATITTAQIANGQYSAALKWSVEMADLVTSITGVPVLFGNSVAGLFGQVGFIGTSPDMASAEQMEESLNKEPHYLAKLDALAGLFVDGSGRRQLLRRIA